uniref:Uncharacterized protein n=1 Tax=Timema cristinae TaxID=61476 RepID=A0A7R9DSZ2_TIMCR|nr:unnamed protein product [Timema cristinae]
MEVSGTVSRVLMGKPNGKRPLGRPRRKMREQQSNGPERDKTNSNSELTFLESKEKKEEYEFSEILANVRRTSRVEDEVVLILFNSIVRNIVERCV